jgi:hypothetical protein
MTTAERVARFWARVVKSDGCWLWQGNTTPDGYGLVHCGRRPDGRVINDYAHRIAYWLTSGPIPDGLVVRHRCDNPPCCNPEHLLLGTQADNIADAQRQGKYKRERPGRWSIPPELRRVLIAQCLAVPAREGTTTRIAKQYGLHLNSFKVAVYRARQKAAAHV